MKNYIKKIIKKLFNYGIDTRTNAETKIAQLNLYLNYRKLLTEGEYFPKIKEVGFKCFSQFEEDGLLLYIFALICFKSKVFVDIGAGDGINKQSCIYIYNKTLYVSNLKLIGDFILPSL